MAMTGKEYGSKPAFPSSRVEEEVRAKVAYNEGVTRRDVIAALALQGILASETESFAFRSPEARAERAVQEADALCAALAKDGAA